MVYKAAVYESLMGRSSGKLPTYTETELYRWLQGEGSEKYSRHSEYRSVESALQKVHEAGQKAQHAGAGGVDEGTIDALRKMEKASETLMNNLEKLAAHF